MKRLKFRLAGQLWWSRSQFFIKTKSNNRSTIDNRFGIFFPSPNWGLLLSCFFLYSWALKSPSETSQKSHCRLFRLQPLQHAEIHLWISLRVAVVARIVILFIIVQWLLLLPNVISWQLFPCAFISTENWKKKLDCTMSPELPLYPQNNWNSENSFVRNNRIPRISFILRGKWQLCLWLQCSCMLCREKSNWKVNKNWSLIGVIFISNDI